MPEDIFLNRENNFPSNKNNKFKNYLYQETTSLQVFKKLFKRKINLN